MEPNEIAFLEDLDNLKTEDLELWVRQHETGISYNPQAPFGNSGDPMDILARTLGMINDYSASSGFTLQEKFENALVDVFETDVKHPYPDGGAIFKFIFIFINIPPKGSARHRLLRILIPTLSQRRLKDIQVGSRDLHYDALQLLIELQNTGDEVFLETQGLDDYLMNNLSAENNPRFCNIALTYFRDASRPHLFFEAFDQSCVILPDSEINRLVDLLISYYEEDSAVSWGHLACWLASRQLDYHFAIKVSAICRNEKLLFCLLRNRKIIAHSQQSGNIEDRFLLVIIIIITAKENTFRLNPTFVELFIQQGGSLETQRYLLRILRQLTKESANEIGRVLSYNHRGRQIYEIAYIGALINLVRLGMGSTDDFSIDTSNIPAVYVDMDKKILFQLKIENLYADELADLYTSREVGKGIVTIPVRNLDATLAWWDVLEQVLISVTFIN
jgi:hypothetical protein